MRYRLLPPVPPALASTVPSGSRRTKPGLTYPDGRAPVSDGQVARCVVDDQHRVQAGLRDVEREPCGDMANAATADVVVIATSRRVDRSAGYTWTELLPATPETVD